MHMTCWDDARRKHRSIRPAKEGDHIYLCAGNKRRNHNSTGRTITENGKETAATYDGRGNILEICTKALDTGKGNGSYALYFTME